MSNQRTFHRAIKWAYIMNFGQQGFSSVFMFALAAMLGPTDFGMLALAAVFVQFIQLAMEQGLVAALIQRKNLSSEHLDSVFWMNLTFSLILMAFCIFLSSWWAGVNHLPQLGSIICALSLMIPIEGLDLVQRAIAQREMDFKSLSVRTNASVVVGGVVGLAMAFRGLGVWALVGQRLTQDAVALGLLWKLSSWRPRFRFSIQRVKELWGFAAANLISKLAVFGNSQSDAVLMGLFFGPTAVGLYRLADRLMNMVLTTSISSLQTVSLPQFSQVQDKPLELRHSVLTFLRLSAIVTVPALIGMAVVSDTLMAALGQQWDQAGDVLKILCMLGIILSFAQFIGPLFQAKSKPHYAAAITWGHVAVSAGALVFAATMLRQAPGRRQVIGIAVTRLGTGILFVIPVFLYFIVRVCHISVRQFLVTVAPSFIAAGASAAAVSLLNASRISVAPPRLLLLADVAIGGLVAAGTLLALDSRLREVAFASWSRLLVAGES